MNRRQWLQAAGFGRGWACRHFAGGIINPAGVNPYPAPRNEAYVGGRSLTLRGERLLIQIFMNLGLRKTFGAVHKNYQLTPGQLRLWAR